MDIKFRNFIFIFSFITLAFGLPIVERDVVCKTGAIDLVLVMDESGSVGQTDFTKALEAAVSLTSMLSIGTGLDRSRVGMVLFDDKSRVSFDLDRYTTNVDVANAIRKTSYSGGGTFIAAGMHDAIEVFQSSSSSRPKVMVLITDGEDNSTVAEEQKKARDNFITVYALGVGPEINLDELNAATGDPGKVFSVGNYSALGDIMSLVCENIVSSIAPPPDTHHGATCGCISEDDYLRVWLDMIFVVDSSNDVSENDFDGVKQLLQQIAMYYPIKKNEDGVHPNKFSRVAVINSGASTQRFINFSSYADSDQLFARVSQMQPIRGDFHPELGIKAAQDMIDEEKESGQRKNVRKVVVLFSSIALDCNVTSVKGKNIVPRANDEFCRIIATMLSEQTTLITVAFKLPEDEEFPYINLGDKCDRFNNSETMVYDIMRALCLANCYCLSPYTQFTLPDSCEKYSECVFVQAISLSYDGAAKTCKSENSTLPELFSKAKNDFVTDLHVSAGFFPFWVGVKRANGSFYYPDESPFSPADFTNWCTQKAQPDNKGDCVFENQCDAFKTGWFMDVCGKMTPAHYFSCQKSSCSCWNYCDF